MEQKELLEFTKYYKGEEENPYSPDDSNRYLFWNLERQYVRSSENGSGWRETCIRDVIAFKKNHPSVHNPLTDESISIERRAIMIFIEYMLEKWMPMSVSLVREY